MTSWRSIDTYKCWKYAVKTDFHGLEDSATELKTVNLTYDSCDRFLPFDRQVEVSNPAHAINDDETWLAVAVGSDIDLYDLKKGKQGIFVGHTIPVSEVFFVPGQSDKLVSWSEDYDAPSDRSMPREDLIIWDIRNDMTKDKVVRERTARVDKASENSVENLQFLLDEQNLGIDLSQAERSDMLAVLKKSLNQIARQRSVGDSVKIDGRLASSFQAPLFNHAGDTLIYLPGPRPESNGDDKWDIELYHLPSGTTKTLIGHRDSLMWIGFSPDDSLVVSACWDGTFRVWDAATGEQKHKWVTDKQNWAGAFKPDGTQFLGTDGNGAIRIWDLKTGDVVAEYDKGRCWRRYLDWSSDGRYIAVGGEMSGEITLFDTEALTDRAGHMIPIQTRVLDIKAVSDDEMTQYMVSSSLTVGNVRWEGHGHRLISATYGIIGFEIVDFDLKVKWRIIPFEPTDDQEADWGRLPKLSGGVGPYRPGYSYLASSDEIALICHDGVRFWKLQASGQ